MRPVRLATAITLTLAGLVTPVGALAAAQAIDSLIATTVNNVQHTVALTWSNDGGERVVIQAKADAAPQDENDGTRVYDGSGAAATVSDPLADQIHYFFTIFSTDGSTYTPGNTSDAWTPPPPATVQSVEPVMTRRDAIYLRISNTPGCSEVSEDCFGVYGAYNVGAKSSYPTAPGPFGDLRINPPNVDLLNVGPNQQRVLHVSVWEVGWDEHVWGVPVHLEVRTGRWLEGLRPKTRAYPVGTSAHRAQIWFGSASKRLQGYVVYGAPGWHPPGRRNHPPSMKPLLRCTPTGCATTACCDTNMRVIGHLADTRPFTFRVYGYDKAGHYRGGRDTVIPHRRGLSIAGRAWWHVENAFRPTVVRDAAGTFHAIEAVSYLARGPGRPWRRVHFQSMMANGLTTSPDGSRVFVGFEDGFDNENYLHVASVPAGSTGLPRGDASNATPYFVADRGEDSPGGPYYTVLGMQGLPDDHVAILMNHEDAHTIVVATGTPGGPFTETTLAQGRASPDTSFIALDRTTGSLVVVARLYRDGQEGDYAWVSTGTLPPIWGQPTLVDSHQPADVPTSLTASRGKVWIGLTRHATGGSAGAFLLSGDQSGTFEAPSRLPHTNRYATTPRLAVRGHTLYALYVVQRLGMPITKAGLRLSRHSATGWSAPTHLSRYGNDVPIAVMPLPHGDYTYAFARH